MTDEFQTADVIALNDKQLERKLKACLYKKLQNARLQFKEKHIKARGRNEFNHFDYITLEDIVLEAIPILLENSLSIHQKFYQQPPLVELIDLETGYSEDFGSNFDGQVDGKNHNQRLQALGSTESYLRRYIYLQILDIVEGDPDATFGKPAPKESKPQRRYKEKADKNIVNWSRLDKIRESINADAEKQDVPPLTVAGEYFTKSKITRDEFRAIKKLLGGQQ
jgi:hypothetical protein